MPVSYKNVILINRGLCKIFIQKYCVYLLWNCKVWTRLLKHWFEKGIQRQLTTMVTVGKFSLACCRCGDPRDWGGSFCPSGWVSERNNFFVVTKDMYIVTWFKASYYVTLTWSRWSNKIKSEFIFVPLLKKEAYGHWRSPVITIALRSTYHCLMIAF